MNKQEEREFIYSKHKGRCAFCGTGLEDKWHISPIIPTETVITETGNLKKINNEVENKLPSCVACNLSRIQLSHGEKTMTLDKFKASLLFSFETMLKENPDYKKAIRYGLITETKKKIIFYFESCEVTGHDWKITGLGNDYRCCKKCDLSEEI